jgi:hypothetical protein
LPSGQQNSKKTLDYLGTIGSDDRGDNLQLSNTAAALVELAGFLIGEATDNLDKKGNTATGETASSMKAKDIEVNGSKLELDIEIVSTYKFLDQGVKGWESGRGKYQFKKIPAGKKMAGAIKAWLKVRKIATKYKAVSANERKNKRIKKMVESKDGLLTGLSYAIANNIKRKGIRPTKFFTNAVKATQLKQKEVYAKAFRIDIIESLNRLNEN